MLELLFGSDTLASSLRVAIPLIFACLAGLWSERSGIVDIGLEGKMLAGAFAAASAAWYFDSPWIGLLFAMIVSTGFALVHGFASISQGGNQVVSGVAINFLALGLTSVLCNYWFQQGGRTPTLPDSARFLAISLPGADAMANVPVVGWIYGIISGHSILTYIALALVPLTAWALARTRFGLQVAAVGENPLAVDTAGISVSWLRYRAVIIAGILCGAGGAFLSTALGAAFIRDMTAGRGFMALAALIFANWRAWPALGATLLFGWLGTVGSRLQGTSVGDFTIPIPLINMLPYVLTVVLLAGFAGKSTPPRAAGIPFTKDR